MPTYAYRCKDCGHAFDIYQSFTDDALTQCPQCEGTLRKVLSPVGVVFKGSGFYRNDSRGAATSSQPAGSSTSGSSNSSAAGSPSSGSTSASTSGASSSSSSTSGSATTKAAGS
ncbi:putative FmdB family regulatory protein [Serinibacter salmoneus]|uniref:Putative FmdB family regulatory protein n=1 Tax=Serinibacter salmoneus TaxID=556530 RepID=A0A2A9D1B3_9MICO|nr:FmdB family zinc ribbon protein [Serinibacter salmoneus]PFG20498.1 putative FmdB family regulatory protein [Serinibacter salmoneus]